MAQNKLHSSEGVAEYNLATRKNTATLEAYNVQSLRDLSGENVKSLLELGSNVNGFSKVDSITRTLGSSSDSPSYHLYDTGSEIVGLEIDKE